MASDLLLAWRLRDGVALTPGADGIVSLTMDHDRKIDLRIFSPKVSDALHESLAGVEQTVAPNPEPKRYLATSKQTRSISWESRHRRSTPDCCRPW
jgi:hypothetical protein